MYSYEDRIRAVKLFIKLGKRAATTVRLLGYPSQKYLRHWYLIYQETGDLPRGYNRLSKYSMAQKQKAIEHYFNHGECFSHTQRVMGYPCAHVFGDWLNEFQPASVRKRKENKHVQVKPAITYEEKKKAVTELCLRQSSVASIARRFGVSRQILYKWKEQFLSREYAINMSKKKNLHESEEHNELPKQIEDLQQRMHQLQLEHDILEQANYQLKKGQGVSHELLTNREKTELIDALLEIYQLKELLEAVGLARSSYFYQKARMKLPDKYAESRIRIKEIFNLN